MSRIHFFTGLLITLAVLSGCSANNNEPFVPGSSSTTATGVISEKNFSMLESDINPAVIDGTTGALSKTDVTLTIYIGDRFNHTLGDAHTVYFRAGYGLINPSTCVTKDGTCTVTWSAIKYPDMSSTGNAPNGYVGVTAYSTGEESFTDTNGNGTFDDGESFQDLEEPYVDVNTDGAFDTGDLIIDVPSTTDPKGDNGVHDLGDGMFNGGGCTHSTLCSNRTSVTVVSKNFMDIISSRTTYTVGGNITGVPAGETAVLHIDSINTNLGIDNHQDYTVTGTGSPIPFTFTTQILDGSDFIVTVTTPPTSAPTCGATAAGTDTGTISGADVTTIDLTCA